MKRTRTSKEKLEILKKAAEEESGLRGAIAKGSMFILNETRTGRVVKRLVERGIA